MSCQKHGYTNNVFCPECDLETIEVNSVTADTPERFREVEPLRLGGRTLAEIRSCYDVRDTLDVRPRYHSIPEARALRDWLNKVLP